MPLITKQIKSVLGEFRVYICNHIMNKIPSHSVRLGFYQYMMGFELGPKSSIFLGARFDAAKGFSLGKNSVVNENCRIDTRGGVCVGNNVSISADVVILTADHDLENFYQCSRDGRVQIFDYVFVGTRAMILPGVTLNEGCVIAAGAIVTRDVAAYTVVAGVPAKKINERSGILCYNTIYRRWFH